MAGLSSVTSTSFVGALTGNADTVTNGVYTTGSYSNPSWLTSLGWSKISSTPTTVSGYGITNAAVLNASNIFTSDKNTFEAQSVTSDAIIDIPMPSGQAYPAILTRNNTLWVTALNPTGLDSYWQGRFQPQNISTVPLYIKGLASQTANLQEWQNSAGTVIARVRPNGQIGVGSTLITDTNFFVNNNISTTNVVATIRGATSQTANLQEWQNSSGTVLSSISSSGAITAPSITLSSALATTSGGTGLTSYATGDILYASATNTLSKLTAGTDGYLLTLSSGVPTWAAAPISLPSQTGNNGKYLTTDGSTASWATLVVPIETGTATVTANTATTVDTTALSGFTSIEYMVSLKQGSKVRTSKVVVQTDGTSVDMTEFAITETGGQMTGVVVSATTSSTNAVLQVTVTDATSTNVDVKFSKVKL